MKWEEPKQIVVLRMKDMPVPFRPCRPLTCAFCSNPVWVDERALVDHGPDLVPICMLCAQERIMPEDEFRGLSEGQREDIARLTGQTEEQINATLEEMERLLRAGRYPLDGRRNKP